MTELRTNIYEGMFLFPQSATADFQGVIDHVTEILTRADADLLAMKKWDERRLAYDIQGNKRGLYILTYFKADRQRVAGIERDCNLSEQLLRSLVVRADHMLMETIEGKTVDQIKQFSADEMLELFRAKLTPNRQKCCLLSWRVVQSALHSPVENGDSKESES